MRDDLLKLARMQWLRFLPAVLLVAGASAAAQQLCEVNGESVDTSNGNSTRGKTGLMRCRDARGLPQREQEIRDGAFVGVERFFHPNGKVREEHARNERGNKHGVAKEYAADGSVLLEATYQDGRQVGLARSFHPGGALKRATYREPAGSEQAYVEFTSRGQLARLRCGPRPLLAPAADDARLCGFAGPADVELFDASGQVRTRLRYLEGKPVRSEHLHANGQPAVTEELDGPRRVEQRFTADGKLQREQVWADGQLASERSYYLNGQPRSSSEWQRSADRALRVNREFHDNGQLASEGTWLLVRGRSQAIGTHAQFAPEGHKVRETEYDDQGLAKRHRAWGRDGELVQDDEVFPDGSRKAFSR